MINNTGKPDITFLKERLDYRIYLAQLHIKQDWGYKAVIFNLYQAILTARELKRLQKLKLLGKKHEKTN